jgi:hypothetical protein
MAAPCDCHLNGTEFIWYMLELKQLITVMGKVPFVLHIMTQSNQKYKCQRLEDCYFICNNNWLLGKG